MNQAKKAEAFLALHHDEKLLVLPNIWDPLGARLLERLGYPAVATASAAVAFSLGYDDGQRIRFDAMVDVVRRIAESVGVPVTADVERGYAEKPAEVAKNVKRIVEAGAVGINIEDSTISHGELFSIDFQCERIRAVRKMADGEGIHLVINARTDVFVRDDDARSERERVPETIERAKAYLDAGADCIYPILLGDLELLKQIREATQAPINVYAPAPAPSMRELEDAGIARLSLGPAFLSAGFTAMKKVAETLLAYGPYDAFTSDALSFADIRKYVSSDPME